MSQANWVAMKPSSHLGETYIDITYQKSGNVARIAFNQA